MPAIFSAPSSAVHASLFIALFLSVPAGNAQSNQQKPGEPFFRTGTSLVRIDLEVTDGTRTLSGFTKDDFVIEDEGKPQKALHFAQGEAPLDLVLLFDTSGSMRGILQRLAPSTSAAMKELRPGDRVAVITFQRRTHVVAPFTEDLSSIAHVVSDTVLASKFGGGTAILAAIDEAGSYLAAQPRGERRRAVLVFTDNRGQRSARESAVLERLWEADTVASALQYYNPVLGRIDDALMIANRASLAHHLLAENMTGVAEKSGGEVIKSDNQDTAFPQAIKRLRERYMLYYALPPGAPGQVRKVAVKLTPEARQRFPSARVRARKGYITP